VARAKADIANTALRIFLQEMGAAYDVERGLSPYKGDKGDVAKIKAFFLGRCCYCDIELGPGVVAQDHLIPMNKTGLGLHAWGNVVPACGPCNAKKQGGDWRDFIIQRAGAHAAERHQRMKQFLDEYGYKPTRDLRAVAEELYEEVGAIAMTLISSKVKRIQSKL
jgi:hypothetical protein